ncbi:MAG: class I SAM-dependent methyltransferase family protein [Asgard group archaeon]|nr:class I SAM-dependent methyltransferase family protein [Asgard group archaeon]
MPRLKGTQRSDILDKLRDKIPIELLSHVPHRWWKIGDILIIPIPKTLEKYQTQIGTTLLSLEEKKIKTVLGKLGPTKDVVRTPEFHYLAGDTNTETVHKELGCYFRIDAAKLTFSPGNHGERKRMIDIVAPNEYIIDMFSCVGNLSLPIAVHKSPKKLLMAEINPYAYKYLVENISLNKIDDIAFPLLGDNRIILQEYEGLADRVLGGYLHCDDQQITQAIRLCKKEAIFHYHEATPKKKETQNRPLTRVKKAAKEEGREISLLQKRSIKKYAPGIEHVVLDIKII